MTTFLNFLVATGRITVYVRGLYRSGKEVASILAQLLTTEVEPDEGTQEL